MPKHLVIAIDGPAGSGKSTVSKLVAKKLGLLYIDTGAMYRALTLKAISSGLNLSDKSILTDLSKKTQIDLDEAKDGKLLVLLDGVDVSSKIRTPELTKNIKFIAGVKGVRERMVELQRKIANSSPRGAVLEGRDIGTVVFKDTKYKFYLDASTKERARRRFKELAEKGEKVNLKDIEKDIILRDESDIKREFGPLKIAEDAKFIDTTDLSIEEVTQKILNLIRQI